MQSFKDFFITEMSKKNKKPAILSIKRGADFAMLGAGKSGLMQSDKKQFKKKAERKQGKDIAKRAMRGDY